MGITMKYVIVLLFCYSSSTVRSCAATVPTTPPRTTPMMEISPRTTTTVEIAATTATTAATTSTNDALSACQSCTADQVLFSPATAKEGTQDALSRVEPDNAAGCKVMTAICTGPAGTIAFMQFNVKMGGPLENFAETVEAKLVCNNGRWVYNDDWVISEVNCISAAKHLP